jgi:hypothetical protein
MTVINLQDRRSALAAAARRIRRLCPVVRRANAIAIARHIPAEHFMSADDDTANNMMMRAARRWVEKEERR